MCEAAFTETVQHEVILRVVMDRLRDLGSTPNKKQIDYIKAKIESRVTPGEQSTTVLMKGTAGTDRLWFFITRCSTSLSHAAAGCKSLFPPESK